MGAVGTYTVWPGSGPARISRRTGAQGDQIRSGRCPSRFSDRGEWGLRLLVYLCLLRVQTALPDQGLRIAAARAVGWAGRLGGFERSGNQRGAWLSCRSTLVGSRRRVVSGVCHFLV